MRFSNTKLTSEFQAPLLRRVSSLPLKIEYDIHKLQHREAVESCQTTFGVALFNSSMVAPRVIWMFVQVVEVRSRDPFS